MNNILSFKSELMSKVIDTIFNSDQRLSNITLLNKLSGKLSDEPEKPRKVLIEVPKKVQVHTEFRLDDTVIGKEVL